MSAKVALASSGLISFPNDTSLASTNKPWIEFSILGADLKAALTLTGAQYSLIVAMGNSDLSALKIGFLGYGGLGTPVIVMFDSAFSQYVLTADGALTIASLSDTLYYECAIVFNDAAQVGNPIWFGVYSAGGFDTGPGFLGSFSNTSTPSVITSAGSGCVFLGNGSGTALPATTGQTRTFDFMKAGNDHTVNILSAPLEEGAGTSVSPGGTISGSFSWITDSPPPPMKFFRRQTFPRRR